MSCKIEMFIIDNWIYFQNDVGWRVKGSFFKRKYYDAKILIGELTWVI